MTYNYILDKKDILALGLIPTNSNEYEIEQSGSNGMFYNMYEVVECELGYGKFKGKEIIKGNSINEDMEKYIIKNCKCVEYN